MTSQEASLQSSTRTTFYGISARLFAQLETVIQTLHKSQVPVAGYDILLARHRAEQQLASQPDSRGSLQQEQIDKFVAQDLLVSHMTQQLSSYSQGLEQLHSICLKQEQRVSCIENHAADLERQVGQKAKRIADLEADGLLKTSQIQGLESQVQKFKRVCSYVTHMVTTQVCNDGVQNMHNTFTAHHCHVCGLCEMPGRTALGLAVTVQHNLLTFEPTDICE